jgi:ABC-2 type transport system permease protein
MRSFWLVARHEYRKTVVRRGFVILTVAIPLGMAALIALAIVVNTMSQSALPVGYVDNASILDLARQSSLPATGKRIQIQAYPDQEAALAALNRQEIQAFFVFPPDYLTTLHTDIYYLQKPPSSDVWQEFDDFVRASLVAGFPSQTQQRLLDGSNITVRDIVSNREFSESAIINIILPFAATFLFFFATVSAAGYMLSIVATEKENRTMEIMLTSLTPVQLIGGKTLGLLAAALTQLGIYVVTAIIALKVAALYVVELQQATVPWAYLGIMALFFLPAYALIAAVMIAIGSVVTELQQGQQVAGILNLFFMIPIFLLPFIIENPGSAMVAFLTLFPTTSFLTISLRWGLGTVPVWQLGTGWVLLVATTAFMVWAAARIFRAGMLRYGQPLTFSSALNALRRQ